ncbi:MAG: hypothetical protein P4N60_20900 [Verrucomicrobiae bacterium]|nr:hypothetical protein [Verrucomicrobiae bacterium]
MSNLLSLSSTQLKRAAAIKDQIEDLNRELAGLLGSTAAAAKPAKASKKGGMSAAGRARVAAAQRARWAKIKAAKPADKAPAKKKFTMSAAAKAKIGAAAKARWAKIKAAKKA